MDVYVEKFCLVDNIIVRDCVTQMLACPLLHVDNYVERNCLVVNILVKGTPNYINSLTITVCAILEKNVHVYHAGK